MPALPPRDVARLRHMREAAEKAIAYTAGRDRSILDSDEMRMLAGQVHYHRVHWFAPSFSLRDRLRRVAREIHMDDFVRVAHCHPDSTIHQA
jgi:hypothetical protein